MKRLFITLLATALLTACDEEPKNELDELGDTEESIVEKTTDENEMTQEEHNIYLKENAVEIEMSKALDEEIKDGTLVRATGEISSLDRDGLRGGDFYLNTIEGDYRGHYKITNFNTVEIELEPGQTVTLYGSYRGIDEEGFQTIIATIIE